MIAFQCSRWFLIGATIMFSILLPLILKTTPSNSGCQLLHGNSDKLKRIHELRNESISNAHLLHDVQQKYRAWQMNYHLLMREELRNNFEEARDDFRRRFEIIHGEIGVVDGEIDAMREEFIKCVGRSTWTRELFWCAWRMARETVEMKILIDQVFKILRQIVKGARLGISF